MEPIYTYMALLGLFGFFMAISENSKIKKLEREIRQLEDSLEDSMNIVKRENLGKYLQEQLGKQVEFEFYDDEGDIDLIDCKITIVDMDEKWLLLRTEHQKETTQRLIRIDSVKNFTVIKDKSDESI